MRAIALIMIKDLLRRRRAPLAPIVFLLFPFVFSGLIALTFGTGGTQRQPRFKIALVDEDQGLVARLVRGALNQDQAARFLEVTAATLPEAMAAIERNRIAGAIVIPAGFSQAVWDHQPAQLRVIRNPAQAIGPVAVEETAEFLALLLSGGSDLLEEPLARLREEIGGTRNPAQPPAGPHHDGDGDLPPSLSGILPGGLPGAEHAPAVAEIAVLVHRSMASAGRFLFPPRIRLERISPPSPDPKGADTSGDSRGDSSGDTSGDTSAAAADSSDSAFGTIFRAVLPGMAAFALFVLAIGLTADIFQERRKGTLARQLAAPLRASDLVIGKMLATVVVGLIVVALMALLGALLLNARADLGAFILLSLSFLLALTGFVSLLYGFARSEQRGATLSSIVMMLMAFLGGSFIPLESLPRVVHHAAPLTLNYWAVRGFQALLFSDAGVAEIAQPLLVLLAVGVVATLLGGVVLQRQFSRAD